MKKGYHTANVLIVFVLLLSTNFIAQNIEQKKLDDAIDQNGKIKFGSNGSYDASGFSLTYGEDGEPLFRRPGNPENIESITWSALGDGLDNGCRAIVISGANIFVGGLFTTAGGVTVNYVAKWDGTNWTALGSGTVGVGAQVRAMAISGSDLYVGGFFTTAGGSSANYIAKFNINTNTWSALGDGTSAAVYCIAASGSDVYAGGQFQQANGSSTQVNYVAKWNGSTWSALGSGTVGVNSAVYALAIDGTNVYVGGGFTTAGGISSRYITKWNSSSWVSMGYLDDYVNAIAVIDGTVYAGGNFAYANCYPCSTVNYLGYWDGSAWQQVGVGLGYNVYALGVYNSNLFIGGDFYWNGNNTTALKYITKWNGSDFTNYGGTGVAVYALGISTTNDKMYVGGYFTNVNGGATLANRIASFNDSENPLPVELISFTANIINNKVSLNWNTATEQNNYGFEIESSVGSRQTAVSAWEKIGFVIGHGNSNSPKDYSFTDNKVTSAGKQCYRLKQIDTDGSFEYSSIVEVDFGQPNKFELKQNYPNPFNPATVISFQLPVDSKVQLKIYDVVGSEVATLVNEERPAGIHHVEFNAGGLASGIYFYSLQAGEFVQTKKFVLMK